VELHLFVDGRSNSKFSLQFLRLVKILLWMTGSSINLAVLLLCATSLVTCVCYSWGIGGRSVVIASAVGACLMNNDDRSVSMIRWRLRWMDPARRYIMPESGLIIFLVQILSMRYVTWLRAFSLFMRTCTYIYTWMFETFRETQGD